MRTLAKLGAAIAAVLLLTASAARTAADSAGEPRVYPVLQEPNHKPIFHNARIDAYEVRIRPGQQSFYHLHARDQFAVTVGAYTSANQVLGQTETVSSGKPGAMSYIPHTLLGGSRHRVRGIDGLMWVVGIEFAAPAPAGTQMAFAAPGDAALAFPQGRAVHLRLAPGESREIAGEAIVPLTPGRLDERPSGRTWTFPAGGLHWIGGSVTNLRNRGDAAVELVVLDLN